MKLIHLSLYSLKERSIFNLVGLKFNPDDDDFDVGNLRVLLNTSGQAERQRRNEVSKQSGYPND